MSEWIKELFKHTLNVHFVSQDLDQQRMMVCFGLDAFSSLNAR